MNRGFSIAMILLCLLTVVQRAQADALVVTKAMTASTILEIFVEDEGLRVELEIGLADLEAFRNLLPDEVYERLSGEPRPFAERLAEFFTQDLRIRVDDGDPVTGRVTQLAARKRVVRDEITGEPLPVQPNDRELVVIATLQYELPHRPATLQITPPLRSGAVSANIGFVAYHHALPVNDFRYLGTTETLDLDWDDPWYSRFRNRNLRRQYDSPISAFLYVEHFEVRKEIVLRPIDLQHWIDLGLEGKQIIPATEQAALKDRVAEFLATCCPVTIDGQHPQPILDRIHFIRRSLKTAGVIDPPQDLPLISATLGVIFIYPIKGLPQEVTMEWDLFNPRIQKLPASATDETGGLPYTVTPDDPVLKWQNFLTNPSSPALVDLTPPPQPSRIVIPVISVLLAICFFVLAVPRIKPALRGQAPSGKVLAAMAILIVGAVLTRPVSRISMPNPLSRSAWVTEQDATTIVAGLLKNVYRAFDFRDESVIYDALARSASGELLADIYLETKRALELRNQGGARAKVKDVDMLNVSANNFDEKVGFTSRCLWNVTGSVGHWGHIHQRRNQYEAEFTIQPVDGVWKITALELLNEQRLNM